MQGLTGDRLLKRFAGKVRRRRMESRTTDSHSHLIAAQTAQSEPEIVETTGPERKEGGIIERKETNSEQQVQASSGDS